MWLIVEVIVDIVGVVMSSSHSMGPPTTPSPPPHPLTHSASGSGLSLGLVGGYHSGSVPPSPDHTLGEGDEAVQATNDDASICKRSAIQLGYWSDPFLQHFMKGPVIRKPPEINRGYYARSYGVYRLLLKTLEKIATSDVVSRQISILSPNLSSNLKIVWFSGVYSEGGARRGE